MEHRPTVTETTRGSVMVPPDDGPAVVRETDPVTTGPGASRRELAYRLTQAIWLIVGVIETLVAMRFVLRLLGANPQAGFSSFIYDVTGPLVAPFAGIFNTTVSGRSVLEPASLVALIVYPLVAWLLARIVRIVLDDTRRGVHTSHIDTSIR
jgi:hypothetical protein